MFQLNISNLDKLLVEEKFITEKSKIEAKNHSKFHNISFEESLIRMKILKKEDFKSFLLKRYDIRSINFDIEQFNLYEILFKYENIFKESQAIPMKIENNSIHIAMAEPTNVFHIENIRNSIGLKVIPYFFEQNKLQKFKQELIKRKSLNVKSLNKISLNEYKNISSFNEIQIDEYIDKLLKDSIISLVSDIHFDPRKGEVLIRRRINGKLEDLELIPISIYPNIVSKIKLISKLDIAEKRRPQDGSFDIELEDKNIDVRVSVIPTIFGEKLVLRIIGKQSKVLDLENIGLEIKDIRDIKKLAKKRQGLILISGPTGSGKSTTLYSILKQINSSEKNIISLEEPVECKIDGVNQVEVNQEIGLSFDVLLKYVLRQDPDVIVVGEIRDKETAKMAISAFNYFHYNI